MSGVMRRIRIPEGGSWPTLSYVRLRSRGGRRHGEGEYGNSRLEQICTYHHLSLYHSNREGWLTLVS